MFIDWVVFWCVLIIDIALCACDNSINPNPSSCIGSSLQVIAALLSLNDEGAMRTSTFGGVHMIQIYLVYGLQLMEFISLLNSFEINLKIYRKVCSASWFSFGFIRVVD